MDCHVCQHVPYEGPAAVDDWAAERGHPLEVTRLDHGESLPAPGDVDLLLVMGGPMGVGDGEDYPWLAAERDLIREVLEADRAVLGICLGAQQLAAALGAEVTGADHREVGWYDVQATDDAPATVFDALPDSYPAFHWHGDTFAIPEGATLTATSTACENQAFVASEGRALGLQFHLEATWESVHELVAGSEIPVGRWVQSREQILAEDAPYGELRENLYALLDRFVASLE
ncbi:type 1 glutamine amidotransferase [Halobacteriales archaeon Cl-PHB]